MAARITSRPSSPGIAESSFFAHVVNCHDGDTCRIQRPNGTQLTLRLIGIDAPELAQNFGRDARDYLQQRAVSRTLRIEIHGRDPYRRYLAILWDAQISLNEELVQNGYAFAYRSREGVLNWAEAAEKMARKKKLGLWALTSIPEEPKIYRSKKR